MQELISVCVATHNRNTLLANLLQSLCRQTLRETPPIEIVVVDNTPAGNAREVVESARVANPGIHIAYDIQPIKNIALTRNLCVSQAKGTHLAFIDDDEYANENWIMELYQALVKTGGAAVIGPVLPHYPHDTPRWIIEEGFFARKQPPDLASIKQGQTNNALICRKWLENVGTFNPAFGLTGGEDTDLFQRITRAGGQLFWAQHAIVHEHIDKSRTTAQWLLRRAFRGGQMYATITATTTSLPRKIMRATWQIPAATILTALALPALCIGRGKSMRLLMKAAVQLGHVSTVLPFRFQEYA